MRLHLDLTSVKLNKTEEKFEEIIRKLEKKVTALENKLLRCSEEHTWKISGFSEILRQAKTEEKNKIDSTPFYTAQNGYKYKLRLYPNGRSFGKNTHLSIYFILMKGEYDPILPWPFHKEVTFTLIDQQENQNDQDNVIRSFSEATNKTWNVRPDTENPGNGFNQFVSHTKLRERCFIVDDTMYIHVKVD